MTRRLKVLHVITGLAAGGAETQLLRVVRASRHDCAVVAVYNAGVVAEQLRAEGYRVHDLDVPSTTDPRALRRLLRVVREEAPDVVHTHLFRAGVLGRVVGHLARVPVVVSTEHSLFHPDLLEGRRASRVVRAVLRRTSRWAQATVAVSDQVRDNLATWGVVDRPGHRVLVVRNGIDTGELRFDPGARARVRAGLGVAEDVELVGIVCRLHPWKRVDVALEGLAPQLGPHRRFVVIGDGAERARLQARAQELTVEAFVHFTGEVGDVASWLSALDLLVSASQSETFGLGVLEALASGLPVAYAAAPVLDELAEPLPGTVRVGGSTSALAAGVTQLLQERRDAGPRSGRPAPAVVAAFDVRATARVLDDLYDDLFDQSRATSPAESPAETPATASPQEQNA
ncbi:glycosyltransferase [Kineococcus sp. NPDC059986]|uniref:glycosyltransferase n=1 Tax=Kineococcus sp. NPDC059986 TaxID=3155538 RepID=UPI00344B0824